MMDMTGASCLDHDAVMLLGDESRMEHLYELLMRRFGLLPSFRGVNARIRQLKIFCTRILQKTAGCSLSLFIWYAIIPIACGKDVS